MKSILAILLEVTRGRWSLRLYEWKERRYERASRQGRVTDSCQLENGKVGVRELMGKSEQYVAVK